MIEARIFYVGRGSAVIIRLGGPGCGKYGIVDCYAGDDVRHPVLNHLRGVKNELEAIEFLVITHPHRDHFYGVGSILAEFEGKIERYCDSGIDPRQVILSAFPSSGYADGSAARDLRKVHSYLKRRTNEHKIFPVVAPGAVIYRDESRDIVVESVAPPGIMLKKTERQLSRYLLRCKKAVGAQERTGDGLDLPAVSSSFDLNNLSSAIKVSHKGSELLLGGDVLARTWGFLLAGGRVLSDAVLLSHHGSYTGFPQKQWGVDFGRDGAVALISGEGRHQPSESVLTHLDRKGAEVHGTSGFGGAVSRSGMRAYVQQFHHGYASRTQHKKDLVVELRGAGVRVKEIGLK